MTIRKYCTAVDEESVLREMRNKERPGRTILTVSLQERYGINDQACKFIAAARLKYSYRACWILAEIFHLSVNINGAYLTTSNLCSWVLIFSLSLSVVGLHILLHINILKMR